MQNLQATTIDEYISRCPAAVQGILHEVRAAIRQELPQAAECISYQMPAYRLRTKVVVYFAACANHVGFYPTGEGVTAFKNRLGPWKHSKGAIQFPYNKPLPLDLIREITRFRKESVEEKS